MNKGKENIIRYIDGEMNEEEKLQFEKMMTEDPRLENETGRVRTLLSEMKASAAPDINETYFINILPEFYSRKSKKKRFIFSRLAYTLSTAAAVILLVFLIFKPGTSVDYSNLNDLSKSFTDSDLNEILNQYADQYSISELAGSATTKTDSIVSNLMADELDLSGSAEGSVAEKYLDTDELLSSIDESEANELYSQLINEDIIKGEKQ